MFITYKLFIKSEKNRKIRLVFNQTRNSKIYEIEFFTRLYCMGHQALKLNICFSHLLQVLSNKLKEGTRYIALVSCSI